MCGGGGKFTTTKPYGDVKYDAQGKVIEGSARGQLGGLAIGQQLALDQLKEGMPDYYGDQTYADMDPATVAAHKQMLETAGGAATQNLINQGRGAIGALGQEASRAGQYGLQAANRITGAGTGAEARAIEDASGMRRAGQLAAEWGVQGANRITGAGTQAESRALQDASGIRGAGQLATEWGLQGAQATEPLASKTMGYGGGATQNLSQGGYAGLTPFQTTQMENLLAGKLDTDYLKPAIAGMASTVGEEFKRSVAPALRTGTINTGQGRGYSTREAVIAGLEGEKLAGALAGQAGQMYSGAAGQALGQRLPAAQLALQAQQQAQQLGLQGGDLRLRGGQLAQAGALGAGGLRAQAGQLGLGAGQLGVQAGIGSGQLAQAGALGMGRLRGEAGQLGLGAGQLGVQAGIGSGQAALAGLSQAQSARQAQLGAIPGMANLPGQMAKYGLEVGARREGQEEKRIGADIDQYNYNQMAERQALENYMRTIQGSYGATTKTPGPSGLQTAGQIASILAALG